MDTSTDCLNIRVPIDIFVWIFDTFYIYLEIKNDFDKWLKESCWKCFVKHFSFKYFPNFAFAYTISSQL